MPVPEALTEGNWKKKGLPLRTTMEKLKNKKTYISEALRAYAAIPDTVNFNRLADKQTALTNIKKKLKGCRDTSVGNRKLLDHLTIMDTALAAEVRRINDAIERLTVEDVLQDATDTKLFMDYLRTESATDHFSFLVRLKQGESKADLLREYIPVKAPQELNLTAQVRQTVIQALTVDVNNATAWEICRTEAMKVVKRDNFRRYKDTQKIKVA
jgi:hypothetical protein